MNLQVLPKLRSKKLRISAILPEPYITRSTPKSKERFSPKFKRLCAIGRRCQDPSIRKEGGDAFSGCVCLRSPESPGKVHSFCDFFSCIFKGIPSFRLHPASASPVVPRDQDLQTETPTPKPRPQTKLGNPPWALRVEALGTSCCYGRERSFTEAFNELLLPAARDGDRVGQGLAVGVV